MGRSETIIGAERQTPAAEGVAPGAASVVVVAFLGTPRAREQSA